MFTLSELAKELLINKGYLSRLSKKPWFPAKGEHGWADVQEVRSAIDSNVKRRQPLTTGKPIELTTQRLSAIQSEGIKGGGVKRLVFILPADASEIEIRVKVQG